MKYMKYMCALKDNGITVRWPARIRLIDKKNSLVEVEIEGRGSCCQVIVDSGTFGNYLCIPSMDIGCALAQITDYYWNTRRLSHHLGVVDATTITTALQYLNQL